MRLVLVLLIFLIACSDEAQPLESTVHANAKDTITTAARPIILSGCYQMTLKRDSATLELSVKDTSVSGKLNYIFFQKEQNAGSLQGVLRNDLIYADCTFASEGRISVREVIFKIDGDMLIPAYGELTQSGNKIIFANKNALQFNELHPFIKVPCVQ